MGAGSQHPAWASCVAPGGLGGWSGSQTEGEQWPADQRKTFRHRGLHPGVCPRRSGARALDQQRRASMTMDTYRHLFPGQEAETVARLPDMLAGPADALQATGIDTKTAGGGSARAGYAQYAKGENRRPLVVIDRIQDEGPPESDERNPLPQSILGGHRRGLAKAGESRPGRGRTSDQGIMSPLL